MFLLQQLG